MTIFQERLPIGASMTPTTVAVSPANTVPLVADRQLVLNTIIFANIVELVSGVITSMSTSDVKDAFNKDGLSGPVLTGVIANRIKETVLSANR